MATVFEPELDDCPN